jgi:hypothetical protein
MKSSEKIKQLKESNRATIISAKSSILLQIDFDRNMLVSIYTALTQKDPQGKLLYFGTIDSCKDLQV